MMLNKARNFWQKGITITELAVSVSIISLLIAGTFGGLTMLKAAKIRKVVGEFTSFMAAINEFQTQYSYLPGDMTEGVAESYWGVSASVHGGNGDSLIDNSSSTVLEDLYVWEHLASAKLIAGTYTGLWGNDPANTVRYSVGVSATNNATNSESFNTGVFSFYVYQTLIYNTAGHALSLGGLASGLPTAGFMLAKDAYSIDAKLDDGLASTGMFYTIRDTSGCTDAASSAARASYVLSDLTNETCRLLYWQKKF